MRLLEAKDVSVAYKKMPVVWSVDFQIHEGSFVAIVGPNGSGKSTLLKACMGLVPLMSGSFLYFENESLERARKRIAYLPQRESIDWDFPIQVIDVVLMGTYPRVGLIRRPSREEKDFAFECLRKVGMQDFASRQISELSGGQQQRVFFARALAQKAELYLFDEPFAGVDAKTENTLTQIIHDLKAAGKSVVLVHHDLFSVAQNTDQVALMNTRLVRFGPTDDVLQREYLEEAYGGQLETFAKLLHQSRKEVHRP
jgi:manganese/zinc/iron transport system ATP- binding protein